jgi:hypothetical protein
VSANERRLVPRFPSTTEAALTLTVGVGSSSRTTMLVMVL